MPVTTNDTRAARAILAYFNRPLILKIVRHVLNESSQARRKRLSDEVLGLVGKAMTQEVWPIIIEKAKEEVSRYIATASFKERLDESIKFNANRWIDEAVKRALNERANAVLVQHVQNWDTKQYLKTLGERFRTEVEIQIRDAAKKAAEIATTTKE